MPGLTERKLLGGLLDGKKAWVGDSAVVLFPFYGLMYVRHGEDLVYAGRMEGDDEAESDEPVVVSSLRPPATTRKEPE